jgi:hypothetical protein
MAHAFAQPLISHIRLNYNVIHQDDKRITSWHGGCGIALQLETTIMSLVRHRYPGYQNRKPKSDRITVFLLIVVVVAAFMALTFGDAGGGSIL